MEKRSTIFPGSHQWADTFSSVVPPVKNLLRPNGISITQGPRMIGGGSYSREQIDSDVSGPIRRSKGNNTSNIPLTVPANKATEISVHELTPIIRTSPWRKYEQIFNLQCGGNNYVTVAEIKCPDLDENFSSDDEVSIEKDSAPRSNSSLVMVQDFYGPEAKKQVHSIQQIRHRKFLRVQEVFFYENTFSAVFKFMPLSLHDIVGNPIINEIRLASILGQILDGLSYLEKNGLEHQQLDCSNILIDYSGNVKIWGYDAIVHSSTRQHIKELSHITMLLMQGDIRKKNDVVGIRDLDRWPDGSRAVDFLSATTSAFDASELLKHPLFQIPWHSKRIQGLVSLANVWSNQGYKYPA